MQPFIEYITDRLINNGYRCKQQSAHDAFMTVDDKPVWICHLDAPLEPEQIRRCFDFPGHVLFVVDEKLIPQELVSRTETPMWLRVLHGLYMGRIYVWNGRYLFGLHFDYDTGDVSESSIIQPDDLLLDEYQTWLRGWGGSYRIARFYDRAWWTGGAWHYERAKQQQSSEDFKQHYYNNWTAEDQKKSDARQEYEQSRDHYWQQQRKREQSGRYGYGEYNTPPPQQTSAKPDFMREFARAGSPTAVKALYRELAKKFHPDLNPGVDTTAEMQAVNLAYERYK